MPALRVHPGRLRLPALLLALAAAGLASPRRRSRSRPQPVARASAPPARRSRTRASMRRSSTSCCSARWSCATATPAPAYQLLLDAARRTRDEALFRRATDIALQARAGDQALAAVLAWREALPDSVEALRYQVQMLVALNRVAEAEEPLGRLLRQAARPALPGDDRRGAALPRPRQPTERRRRR